MRRLLLFLAASTVLTFGGQASGGALSSPSSTNGRIAFPMEFGDRLLTMNPDGTGAAVISYAHDVSPAWSPDGSLLAVSSYHSGNGDIFLLSPDGRQRRQLTTSADLEDDPSWAPCGCLLAYDRTHDDDSAVYTSPVGSPDPQVIANAPGCDEDPAFSPDGTQIAFASCRSGSSQIYVMNADGSKFKRLTHDAGEDHNPDWSPDGTQIAFDSQRESGRQVWVVQSDGTAETALTPGPYDKAPAWSPDGRSLAYDAEVNDNTVIVMSVVGPYSAVIGVGGGAPAWQGPQSTETDCTNWGTPADDILIGGPGRDVLCGSSGNDHVNGGPGSDLLRGSDGNDVLDARDGAQDVVDGGAGFDTAILDRFDFTVDLEDVRYDEPRNLARGRPVTASYSWADSPPSFVVDGVGATGLWWGSYYAPQWIEIDLGQASVIRRIELVVAQTPPGETVHVIRGRDTKGRLHLLKVSARQTGDGDVIIVRPKKPWHGIRSVRVSTLESPSWVAWKEIRVLR